MWQRVRCRRGFCNDDHHPPSPHTAPPAWRALESAEPEGLRLFCDPLAAALAGPDAVREAERLAKPWPRGGNGGGDSDNGKQPTLGRRFCVSNVGARVWWFDARLLAALRAPGAPRQVVVLGAGCDSRPWRLALPPGVRWFEADLPGVAAAKRRRLAELGAAFEPAASPAEGKEEAAPKYPLRAASWASVGADLSAPGVGGALAAAGLDAGAPVAWVAEGLLMYLTAEETDALLREVAGECVGARGGSKQSSRGQQGTRRACYSLSPFASRADGTKNTPLPIHNTGACAPGSVLVAHNSTQELVDAIRRGDGYGYGPFSKSLMDTWKAGFPAADAPDALAARLRGAGWPALAECTSRARIAAAAVKGLPGSGGDDEGGNNGGGGADALAARIDFEARVDAGNDRAAVMFVATK